MTACSASRIPRPRPSATSARCSTPDSLKVVENIKVEPYLAEIAKPGVPLQFQRIGYFTLDPDSTPGSLIFNRTIALKDSWEKINK